MNESCQGDKDYNERWYDLLTMKNMLETYHVETIVFKPEPFKEP